MYIVYSITLGSKALNPRVRVDFSRDMVDSLKLGARMPYRAWRDAGASFLLC